MRNPQLLILSALVAAALAGCATTAPAPSPTPRGEESASPTPSALPTVETVLASLEAGPNDDRAPTASLGVVLEPGQPQFLEDARAEPFGAGLVRVACANDDGSDVSVTVTIDGVDPVTFTAPCGEAPVTLTTNHDTYAFSAAYRFDVSSQSRAVVAVGVVPDAPQ